MLDSNNETVVYDPFRGFIDGASETDGTVNEGIKEGIEGILPVLRHTSTVTGIYNFFLPDMFYPD